MANNNQNNSRKQSIKDAQNVVRMNQEAFIREHSHKPGDGQGKVISIHDYNGYIQNKDKYPASTVICTECGAIFEAEAFQPDEINSGIYMFSSMLHQIKLNAALTPEDKQNILDGFEAIETLSRIGTFYNNMVNKLSGNNKNNSGKNKRGKGHIGLDQSMLGNRSYGGN